MMQNLLPLESLVSPVTKKLATLRLSMFIGCLWESNGEQASGDLLVLTRHFLWSTSGHRALPVPSIWRVTGPAGKRRGIRHCDIILWGCRMVWFVVTYINATADTQNYDVYYHAQKYFLVPAWCVEDVTNSLPTVRITHYIYYIFCPKGRGPSQ